MKNLTQENYNFSLRREKVNFLKICPSKCSCKCKFDEQGLAKLNCFQINLRRNFQIWWL